MYVSGTNQAYDFVDYASAQTQESPSEMKLWKMSNKKSTMFQSQLGDIE